MSISKIWAHAWIDYLFYDTELYYTFVKNKNYELPDPPIDYNFKSSTSDPMLPVNLHHAFIIRAFHTGHEVNNKNGLLKDRDWRLLQKAIKDELDEIVLALLERQTRKMILKIIKNPMHWKAWLHLFDDENIYEETITSDERRESAMPTPVITMEHERKVTEENNPNPVQNPSKQGFYTIEETAREYIGDLSGQLEKQEINVEAEFVLKVSPSEQGELDRFDNSRKDTKISQIPQLRIDESLITDQDSQIFSPRLPCLTMTGLFTPTAANHRQTVSLTERSKDC